MSNKMKKVNARPLGIWLNREQETAARQVPVSEVAQRLSEALKTGRAFLIVSRKRQLHIAEIPFTEGFAQAIAGPYAAVAEMHEAVDFIDKVGLMFDGNQRLLEELSASLSK